MGHATARPRLKGCSQGQASGRSGLLRVTRLAHLNLLSVCVRSFETLLTEPRKMQTRGVDSGFCSRILIIILQRGVEIEEALALAEE